MNNIYLDHNAATPLHPAAREAMSPYLDGTLANPAAAHRLGRKARQALEDAREKIASLAGAKPDEVVFTSGATEANNLALRSHASTPPAHLIASAVEHPSVGEVFAHHASHGFAVDHAGVTTEGVVTVEAITSLLRPETRLVAVMLANHETGAVMPVSDIVASLPAHVRTHTDATQAVGKIAVSFASLNVSTLAFSAHKFHGPVGVGALLVRRGVPLAPLHLGGHQQHGRRPGTEPVAAVVGMAAALDLAVREMAERARHVATLRRQFLDGLRPAAYVVNGPLSGGMPNTLNLSFPGVRGDLLLMALDLAGVACSTGAACSSGSLRPSPVVRALGVDDDRVLGALRFSLGATTTADEVQEACRRICRAVNRLRAESAGR